MFVSVRSRSVFTVVYCCVLLYYTYVCICTLMLSRPLHTVHPSHPVAIGSTPPMHPRQVNSSLSASPFDPSFLHALGQQTSPTEKEDLLSDSLGMLSTVAMYHSELSSSLGTPIQNKMADIRITSSYGEPLIASCIQTSLSVCS